MKKTWILVANKEIARLYENIDLRKKLRLINTFENPIQHSSQNDKKELLEQRSLHFAKEISGELQAGRNQNSFTDLILISEPNFLGLLKRSLPRNINARLFTTIKKDLTKQSEPRISDVVSDELEKVYYKDFA